MLKYKQETLSSDIVTLYYKISQTDLLYTADYLTSALLASPSPHWRRPQLCPQAPILSWRDKMRQKYSTNYLIGRNSLN